jgi:nitrite reductase/ring-hydroxylating ferredoxin subunit
MTGETRITAASTLADRGSFLFTVEDPFTNEREAVVVPCEESGVEAWLNRCTHEDQRFDRGRGVAMRDGELICPRHGSMFDACEGTCDNGPAAGTTLSPVEVTVEDDVVYLTDDDYTFRHEGGIEDDNGPDSTSHLSF